MMKMNKLFFTILLLMLMGQHILSQPGHYAVKREIKGITSQWHAITLPEDAYAAANKKLTDIRIYGISKNDTIEVPYQWQQNGNFSDETFVDFTILNRSSANGTYYYTLKSKPGSIVNNINLYFKQNNFDFPVKAEGSHDQQKWFTIVDNYRILSIHNKQINFSFTKITFPDTDFPYLRLSFKAGEDPELQSAMVSHYSQHIGKYKKYDVSSMHINRQNKQTVIEARLNTPVPVCSLKVYVKDTTDYYRPVTIQYVTDSVKTDKGWIKHYTAIDRSTLNSIDKNNIAFRTTTLQHIRIIIDDYDNKPLHIDSISLWSPVMTLMARFDDPDMDYALYYGNPKAKAPDYDISYFHHKIPDEAPQVTLGEKAVQKENVQQVVKPLIENKLWLWCLIILIVITLGWFSLKMLKDK